jgi:3-deoxy-D-manno-octulosonic-acid transferase
MIIYNLILYLISPYLISRVLIEAIRRKSGISFIRQRLGLFSKKLFKEPIWIHASSVGETKVAISLYKSLSKKFPEETFLITTNTSSSRSIIPTNKNLEHAYLPLDWLFTTRRFINLINPRICILIETELWPNLISICKNNNISIIIANARLSKRTTESPSFIKRVYKKVLLDIDLILCKSNRDKEKYIQLGYLDKNIKVIGNLKYADTNNTIYNNENIVNRKYVLALSTHPDEERQIITEWMRINEKKVLLVIMPRHPERLGDILSDIPLDMLSISIRSKNEPIKKSTQIYIADTYGEANLFLEHCEFVYLGGSLVDHGGQNFMEAASYGKTIIVGPYMYNFIEETEEFLKNNAMIMVKSSPTLKHVFERLIKSKQRRELFGANAKKILLSKKDIINDYCKEIQSLL